MFYDQEDINNDVHFYLFFFSFTSRKVRGAEFGLLTHPGLLLQDDAHQPLSPPSSSSDTSPDGSRTPSKDPGPAGIGPSSSSSSSCEPLYQSTTVHVYASFAVANLPPATAPTPFQAFDDTGGGGGRLEAAPVLTPGESEGLVARGGRYLLGLGVLLDVTELVKSELRMSDPTVATFREGTGSSDDVIVVDALQPGSTEIQVVGASIDTSLNGVASCYFIVDDCW